MGALLEGKAEAEEEEEANFEVEVRTLSGATIATAFVPPASTGAAVKAIISPHLAKRDLVQSLVTEDGRVVEDTTTLAELGFSDVARLTAVLGRAWWAGEWTPCKSNQPPWFVLSNDLRVGDYMDPTSHLFIRENGEAHLVSSTQQNFAKHFRGDLPSGGRDTFTVTAYDKQRGALEGMRLIRQPGGTIRAYHLGTFFSWLRRESAYIEYEVTDPSEEAL